MFLYYLLNSSSFDPKFGRKDICYPIETDRQLLRHSSAISLVYTSILYHFHPVKRSWFQWKLAVAVAAGAVDFSSQKLFSVKMEELRFFSGGGGRGSAVGGGGSSGHSGEKPVRTKLRPLKGPASKRPGEVTEGWTLDRLPLYSTGLRLLWGSCPAYITATIKIYQSRGRISMIVSSLWANGFSLSLSFSLSL